ncbi:hypothetical protein E3N88_15630 [Mikania micrantha]|uniref:Pentatricopeptide repeat-containing protein n=1 Tax=Mikania micrantha TaxID=192012 RepID=A0A5N6NVY8_9ASTR|nr:hypothetical protein E3N88_15630 [Mikania micrantha]
MHKKTLISWTALPSSSGYAPRANLFFNPLNPRCRAIHRCTNPVISAFLPKGFSEITQETVGKSLHAFCIKNYLRLSIFHSNTLINMYLKFGKFKAAWHVFDEMPHRNEVTWNTMISALVRVSLYSDAFLLFSQMRAQGFETNGFVITSLLTGCTGSGAMVHQGFQLHGLIVKNGFLYDVYAGTALLNFYAAYGFYSCARNIFEKMPEKNVVSCTSLMVGYSDHGDFMEVINLYKQMRLEDVNANQNTFTTVITSTEDELLGLQVLGHVVKCGYESNVSVTNSLISMFGNLGRVQEACYVFNHMSDHDIISWNSMISAYSLCGSLDNFLWGDAVHGLVHKLGFDLNLSVCNTLLGMYSETARSKEMTKLFSEMHVKDLISWNSLIARHVQEGKVSIIDFVIEMSMEGDSNATTLKSECSKKPKSVGCINYQTKTRICSTCKNGEFEIISQLP